MLIYFKVANYKSIKEPAELNFNAASISEHIDTNLITEDNISVIKSIVLYGHNASGKSKILDALIFFRYFIINSATEKQRSEEIGVEPFALNESTEHLPSYFEASFLLDKVKFRYGFEADKERIHKEWLLEAKATKEYPLFLRINDDYQIDEKRFDNAGDLAKRTRKNALFLSVASQWNVKKAEKINEWFAGIFPVHGMRDDIHSRFTIELLKDKKYSSLIKQFIRKADLGINDLGLSEIPVIEKIKDAENMHTGVVEPTSRKDSKTVYTLHNKYNAENEQVESIPFYLNIHESEGTKKFFNIIGTLIFAIYNDRLVIIDEFDSGLHPLFTKAILKLFNSSDIRSKAQLLVASHNTALLDKNLLRRDQIYFVEKNPYGATEVTSLAEYKPRKESPYDKNYLEGKYGAIPIIEEFESLMTNG
jgi:AAA15 family ATPase/GTPase